MSDDDRDNDLESDSTNLKSTRVSSESRKTGKNKKGRGRADKRAHHNALERKRRDHIKDSFSSLRETLPCVAGEKSVAVETPKVPSKSRKPRKKTTGKPKKKKESVNVGRTKASSKSKKIKKKRAPSKKEEKEASRAQVLKKAADYIQMMRRKNTAHQHDIEDLRKQNKVLEDQIRNLEKAKGTANYASGMLDPSQYSTKGEAISAFDGGSGSESSDTDGSKDGRRKKLKTSLIDTPLRA